MSQVTVTTKASEKINEFIKDDKDGGKYLRMYVQGGGCSGLSYGIGLEKEPEDDDLFAGTAGSEDEDDENGNSEDNKDPVSSSGEDSDAHADVKPEKDEAAPKRRGRPKGTKNKDKENFRCWEILIHQR